MLTASPEKEKAPGANPTQQTPDANPSFATGKVIPLCKKDNKILKRLRRDLLGVLETVDEIVDCDIPRNERALYVDHVRLLLEGVCCIGASRKALTGTIHRAKALEVAK